MKRHPALQPLSDDHHGALVLARRLRRSGLEAARTDVERVDPDSLARETRLRFAEELEPHFRVEEAHLLPLLARRGEADLAARADADHARLRELVAGPWTQDTAREVGTLLEQHVRFEERVMFPALERMLDEAELARVREVVAWR